MNFTTLCEKLGLDREAIELVQRYDGETANYEALKAGFYRDREALFASVKERADYRQFFLYLFVRLAADAREAYQIRGISDEVYFDTFSDIRIWSEECKRKYGVYGIEEYMWLQEHVRLALFRLGRLQFQPLALYREFVSGGRRLAKGQIVLNVHIAAGEPLDPQSAEASFEQARAFFRGVQPVFVCHSWLLYPGLGEVLGPDSNIMRFQRMFDIQEIDETSRQAEERIFGELQDDPSTYEARTGLQRRARDHLAAGGKLGAGAGIYVYGGEFI